MNFGGTIKLNPLGIFLILGLTFIFLLYMVVRKPSADKQDVNLKELLIAAIHVAEKGGEEIKKVNRLNYLVDSKGKTKEGVNDVVTDADYKSHCVMYYGLLSSFSTFLPVISEELPPFGMCTAYIGTGVSLETEYTQISEESNEYVPLEDVTVWIDPLDATKEFTEQLTQYVTTMVCVAVKGRPVIGVIHRPFNENHKTSWAWVDRTISDDLKLRKKFQTSDTPNIIISRSHAGDQVNDAVHKAFHTVDVTEAGGAGYKVLQVIDGNASAYVHVTRIKKWDICAGDALLAAVGGRMTTLKDEQIDYSFDNNKVITTGILATTYQHEWFYNNLYPHIGNLLEN